MNQPSEPTMFSSGLEVANLLLTSDLLHHSWDAIAPQLIYRETNTLPSDPASPLSIKCQVQQSPIRTIISFIPSSPCNAQYLQTEGRDSLVSSDALAIENSPLFQFVSTKANPTFSLNRAAVTLFSALLEQLLPLKTQYDKTRKEDRKEKTRVTRPLIVTGHSIGGSIATLFTLWLLENALPTDAERPLCITFGSPLLGDSGLQQAISERPTWNPCFLHVVSYKDPIPKLLTSSPQNEHSTQSVYKLFGTFLFCLEAGFACFEEPESALDLLLTTCSDGLGSGGPLDGGGYGEILEKYKHGVTCRGVSQLEGKDFTPHQMGIYIQIPPTNVETTRFWQRQQENRDFDSLIAKIETMDIAAKNRIVYNPDKDLNKMKINMAYLEWYKKFPGSVAYGGYYDSFKTEMSKRREEIVLRKRILNQYWRERVQEVEKLPQTAEGKFFQDRWLYGGNNYRRLAEPLDIAEFYRNGNTGYLAQRSDHYKKLEEWLKHEKPRGNQQGNARKRDMASSLTVDSCFWANVEEAVIKCDKLKNEETTRELKESLMPRLVEFEGYVMGLIDDYAVSIEIFFKESSFMKWWEVYKKIKGDTYDSRLAKFMSDYEKYA